MWLTRVRRTSYGVTAALGVALLSASCTSAAAGPAATTHITVGALPVVDNVGLYIAADEGIFEQVGLRVTIKQVLQSTLAIPAMQEGEINIIGGANNVSFMQAAARDPVNPPFRLVMEAATCAPGTFDVLTLPDSRIARPANLAGKTIAVNLTDNVQTLTINAILKDDGVNPNSVHYKVVPFPKMVAALVAHQVDAISAVEPFATGAKAAGAQMVLSECQGPTASFPLSGYFATSSWVQSHPNTARAFQQALEKGQAYAGSNPESIRSILPTYTKITSAAAAKLGLNSYPSTLDASPMQRIVTMMVSGGMLTKPLDVNSLLLGS